ncbi:bacillithiol biosynthesis protein BshC, partial [Staphylococcus epidermidis]|uniref:bacillithiol biosynthesis protein BshC n=1 Tax=Staphylococcus epidermidis TaxID=1282 RepID=UPI0037DA4A6F
MSNNLLTPPLLHQSFFNTLPFIPPPTQIKYSPQLKPLFHTLNLQIPILIPTLTITYFYATTKNLLEQYNLSIQ